MSTVKITLTEAIKRLTANTNLTNFSDGSVIKTVLQSLISLNAEENYNNEQLYIKNTITTSFGDKLDEFGLFFGIERNQGSYSQGYVTITISSNSGYTVNDLLSIMNQKTGGNYTEIIIPAGTRITSKDSAIVFTTINDAVLTDDGVDVEVLSYEKGDTSNISANTLVNFSNLEFNLSFIKNYLIVTNKDGIVNGSDEESDENYRYRLANFYTANAGGNELALRLAAFSVSGVADVITHKYRYGIGSADFTIISTDPITSQGLISAVLQAIKVVSSCSEKITVSSPIYEGISYRITLEFKDVNLSSEEKDTISSNIKNNIINYINSLALGEELIYSNIQRNILNNDSIKGFTIDKAVRGTYDVDSGYILYGDPILLVSQEIDGYTTWVTNSNLIEVCY